MSIQYEQAKEKIYRYRKTEKGRDKYNSLQRLYALDYYYRNRETIKEKKAYRQAFRVECRRLAMIDVY